MPASEPARDAQGSGKIDAMAQHAERLGRVVSVSGSQVVVLQERQSSNPETDPNGALPIGTLVKMQADTSTIFGMVSGLSIPMPTNEDAGNEMKIVELELLGECAANGVDDGKLHFRRGVSVFPSLGDSVFATGQEDLSLVYACPQASTVKIGHIFQDQSLPAYVVTDDLLGKHFAILGATGSGKSCAVALVLRALLEHHSNAHIVLLDPHNEYARAFGEKAEVINPDNLQLPYWLLNFEEVVEVVLGGTENRDTAQTVILNEAITAAKRSFSKDKEAELAITVDTPVPYRLTDLGQFIDDAMGRLDKPEETAPYLRLKSRIAALRADSRFGFMFGGLSVRDNMAEILSRILRIPVDGKPITIMDLSGIPSEVLNVVVSVLCRLTFDFAIWSERSVPILLVCEEAHRYAPQNSELGFEPTKRALSRIAKEGRKYGVSLCVVSQRPSELAISMLSQCSTIFALRLNNQKDQDFVNGAISESAIGLLDFLPSLRNAEAIAVGEGIPVPMRLCFDTLSEEHRPLSATASFSSAWQNDEESEAFLTEVIGRWRRQRR